VSLVKSLLIHQSIRTTRAKARAVKPVIDKLVSLARKNNLAARRQAFRILQDHKLVSLLFGDIAARFSNNFGGYTRMLSLGTRRGDNAELAVLELTVIKKKEAKPAKKEKSEQVKAEAKPEAGQKKPEKAQEEKKAKTEVLTKEDRPPITQKPTKKFLGGLRNIFKKERDSL